MGMSRGENAAGGGPVNRDAATGATLTRLGRAVLAGDRIGPAEPQHREQHRRANWLRDVILGGQDGLVNILGIVLGVIAGGGSRAVLLAAGFAAAITESKAGLKIASNQLTGWNWPLTSR